MLGAGPAGRCFTWAFRRRIPEARVILMDTHRTSTPVGAVVLNQDALECTTGPELMMELFDRGAARWQGMDLVPRPGDPTVHAGVDAHLGVSRATLLEALIPSDRVHRATAWSAMPPWDLLVHATGVHCPFRDEHACQFGTVMGAHSQHHRWFQGEGTVPRLTIAPLGDDGFVHMYPVATPGGANAAPVMLVAEAPRDRPPDHLDKQVPITAARWGVHQVVPAPPPWRPFVTLTNRQLHHRNHVLLGDAAHTTHFSVGLGTRLAMEDAIALARHLATEATIPAALRRYSDERMAVIRAAQRAAQRSMAWFEAHLPGGDRTAPKATPLSPHQRALSLFTRTHRLTLGPAGGVGSLPRLGSALEVRGVTLPNRLVVSPMCQYRAIHGNPRPWHGHHWRNLSLGGAGLVMTEMVCVAEDGRITPGCLGLYHDDQVPAWERAISRVADTTASPVRTLLGIQLGHAGPRAGVNRLWHPQRFAGPMAQRFHPQRLDNHDKRRIRHGFTQAAQRVKRLNVPVLELHMAHGYLLSSFISPLTPGNSAHQGFPLARRLHFPLEVLRAVRDVWSGPLLVRISAVDGHPGGHGADEAVQVAGALVDHGADVIDVSAGQTHPQANPGYGRCYLAPLSERIRLQTGAHTMVVGQIPGVDDADTLVVTGRADLVALGRAHLRNPFLGRRVPKDPNLLDPRLHP